MKSVIALVTLILGTLLILLPTMYSRTLDSDYCTCSIVAGIGMCISGVTMGFMIVWPGRTSHVRVQGGVRNVLGRRFDVPMLRIQDSR
jgi:hypothetical protein